MVTTPVVGTEDQTHWSQVIADHSIYGVIEIEDGNGQAATIGRNILHELTEASQSIVSLKEVEGLMALVWDERIVTLVIVVPVRDVLYICLRGSGAMYLRRNGHIAKLMSHEGSISGKAKIGDVCVIASKTANAQISEAELLDTVDHITAREAAEAINVTAYTKDSIAGAAWLFMEVKNIEYDEEEPRQAYIPAKAPPVIEHTTRPSWKEKVSKGQRTISKGLKSIHFLTDAMHHWWKKPGFWAIGILALILIVSIGIGLKRGTNSTTSSSIDIKPAIIEAQKQYDEGMALIELNAVKSKERLIAAKNALEAVKAGITNKTKEGRQAIELLANIEQNLTRVMQINYIEPELFYDASLIKTGSTMDEIAIFENQIAALDKNGKSVIKVALDTKKGEVAGGGSDIPDGQKMSMYGNVIYALTGTGVQAINTKESKLRKDVIKKTEEWSIIQSMTSFGGNVYLLDTGKSRIWKYVSTDKVATGSANGFSTIKEYLNPDTLPDLSSAISMAIDGSVWLGTNTGKIMRFTQGKENSYNYKGVEPAFGKNLIVYTSDELTYLYVLDKDNKRVVVLEKDGGMYIAQFAWKTALSPTNLVVTEKPGRILLLSDGKLYLIPMK